MDTMPAPVVATPPLLELAYRLTGKDNVGVLDDRTITHSIDLHTVGDTTTRLQLAVSHSKESRRFTALLTVVGVIDRGDYSVTVSRPFDRSLSRRLLPKDVSRYSEKALIAYRDETARMLQLEPDWLAPLNLGPWNEPN